MKDGVSFKRPPSEARINIDLQLNLFNTWTKYGVAEYYYYYFWRTSMNKTLKLSKKR